ncbi:hypothetical protein BC30077_p241 (plasmid) [Bacillus cereus]|nr:hypothetical protein BC30077_p241 [Bacillus cereus]
MELVIQHYIKGLKVVWIHAVTTPKKHKQWESLREIAKENGISTSSFYARMDKGMDPYEAATKPLRKYKKKQIS